MNELKLRVELNKGRVGIPLEKLGRVVKETLQFLIAVDEDIGIGDDPKSWVALNFGNNSVNFDCMRVGELEPTVIDRGNRVIHSIMANDYSNPEIDLLVSPVTRLQYAQIASPIDADEKVLFGLYGNQDEEPADWFELTKESATRVIEDTPQVVAYYGEIQGIVHAFYKERASPKLVIRELSTRTLVDCFFTPDMYKAAVETLLEPNAVIFVEGEVLEDRAKGQVASIQVADFRPAPDFDDTWIDSFVGSYPEYTGNLTTDGNILNKSDKLQELNLRVCQPEETELLPPAYRQGDILQY